MPVRARPLQPQPPDQRTSEGRSLLVAWSGQGPCWLPLGSGAYVVGVDTAWGLHSLPASFYCLIREQWHTWFARSVAGRKVCCNADVAALAVVLPKMGR